MPNFIITKYDLYQHLNNKKPDKNSKYIPPVPAITLQNNILVSIQASETHYCSPKINYGVWNSVELCIDSKYYKDVPHELLKYNQQEVECPVMGYVPIDLVVAFIIISGGIISLTEENEDG